jgi:hypothetical protein
LNDTMPAEIAPEEVLALLFPEPAKGGQPAKTVTAFVRDPQGGLMLQTVVPNRTLLKRALVAGRANDGTPIVDPVTREVIGYELSPLAVA